AAAIGGATAAAERVSPPPLSPGYRAPPPIPKRLPIPLIQTRGTLLCTAFGRIAALGVPLPDCLQRAPPEGCAGARTGRSQGVSILVLPPSPPISIVIRAALGLGILALASCAGQEGSPASAGGQLFARGLDEIAELYIEPVSS